MIEHYQGQTGEVAKRPQQVHAFQERWAEISWAKRCQHPQHAIEQSVDPHNLFTDKKIVGTTLMAEGQQLLHQLECIQSNAAPVGAETTSLAPSGILGSAKQCATVLTKIGKTLPIARTQAPLDLSADALPDLLAPGCPPVKRRKSCSHSGAVLNLDHRFIEAMKLPF